MWVTTSIDARGVALVTIRNGAKLNALSMPVQIALIEAMVVLGQKEQLRVVVLRGEGDRAFIGGADLRDLAGLDAGNATAFITRVHLACHVLRTCPVPVIARIQGYVLGAGLEIAAACDFRVASDDAVFGMPEVKIGVPSVVEAALLPQLIGWGRTRQMLLTGENISAATASSWGLVEEVVPAASLDDAVERLVAPILASGPKAVRLQKELIRQWEELPASGAVQAGIACFARAFESDEPNHMIGQALERMRKK